MYSDSASAFDNYILDKRLRAWYQHSCANHICRGNWRHQPVGLLFNSWYTPWLLQEGTGDGRTRVAS